MHILLLAKKPPYPAHDGEAIAIMQMAMGLAEQGCKVDVLYMNTPKHHFNVEAIPEAFSKKITFYEVRLNNNVTSIGALMNLIGNNSYHVQRFFSKQYLQKLLQLIKTNQYSIIQSEGLYLIQYLNHIKSLTSAKLIYRSHNIESEIWKNIAGNTNNKLKAWYLKLQSERLLKYEKNIPDFLDAIIPISTSDSNWYQQLGYKKPVFYAPTGINLKSTVVSPTIAFKSIYFIGGLDWIPNIEGINWFINEAFPKIKKSVPEAEFHLAGRNGGSEWSKLKIPGFIYYGEVPDADIFAADKNICIVPLFSGSGMKIKIVEAMNMAKPIVTTTKGAEGMPPGTEEHVFVANTKEQFIEIIITLLQDAEMSVNKGIAAKSFVRNTLSNSILAKKLIQFYQTLSPQ